MQNQQTQLPGKPTMSKSGWRIQVLECGYVSDQSCMKSAVLIFHHFVFTCLMFLSLGKSGGSPNVSCPTGYMPKNRKCEGKKRQVHDL